MFLLEHFQRNPGMHKKKMFKWWNADLKFFCRVYYLSDEYLKKLTIIMINHYKLFFNLLFKGQYSEISLCYLKYTFIYNEYTIYTFVPTWSLNISNFSCESILMTLLLSAWQFATAEGYVTLTPVNFKHVWNENKLYVAKLSPHSAENNFIKMKTNTS